MYKLFYSQEAIRKEPRTIDIQFQVMSGDTHILDNLKTSQPTTLLSTLGSFTFLVTLTFSHSKRQHSENDLIKSCSVSMISRPNLPLWAVWILQCNNGDELLWKSWYVPLKSPPNPHIISCDLNVSVKCIWNPTLRFIGHTTYIINFLHIKERKYLL